MLLQVSYDIRKLYKPLFRVYIMENISKTELYTAQEHALFGSNLEDCHLADPYKPQAVIENIISIEECNQLRQKREEGKLKGVLAGYWGKPGTLGTSTLEALCLNKSSPDYGKTIRDPVLLDFDSSLNHFRDLRFKFPYKRNDIKTNLKRDFNLLGISERILKESGRIAKDKFMRYLTAEIIGTAGAFAAGAIASNYRNGNEMLIGYASMMGENAGFYGAMIAKQIIEDIRKTKAVSASYGIRGFCSTLMHIAAEFGLAESIDSPIIRPFAIAGGTKLFGAEVGIGIGKLAADACFYLIAGTCHEVKERLLKKKSEDKR